jgi:hypothetical protein
MIIAGPLAKLTEHTEVSERQYDGSCKGERAIKEGFF